MGKGFEEGTLKRAKLAKTRTRRENLSRERRLAELGSSTRRNDLLPDLAIREYRIAELRPPTRRTRKNNGEQIERIARSMSEFGFTLPVLVKDGQVLDGWLRVLAAQKLGLELAPAIECNHLDDVEARTLAVALNRIGERGEWDIDELRIEFHDLVDLGVDLDATGFSAAEQDIILLDPLDAQSESEEANAVPEPPDQPVTRLGDVWELGPHRVMCGDALDGATYTLLLLEESAHAVLTDPPYNVKIKGNVSGLGKKVHDEFAMASGEMSGEEFHAFLARVLSLLASFVVANAVLFAFMDWRSIHRLALSEQLHLNLYAA